MGSSERIVGNGLKPFPMAYELKIILPLDGGGLRWGWNLVCSPSPQPSPARRLCRNRGNCEKCHAELDSASNGINKFRDPETSPG